jgi:glucosamine--fructose-6-phosphate aminotransferase (isomerizing)
MCGIIAYTGKQNAASILIDGLLRLEYRGYDSAGIALQEESTLTHITKVVGPVSLLANKTSSFSESYSCGMGHTRWATHGSPTMKNAHPIQSMSKNITIVHNGIIENYLEIKNKLLKKGIKFRTDTDTEVLANLIDSFYTTTTTLGQALTKAIKQTQGAYTITAMSGKEKNIIAFARTGYAGGIVIAKNNMSTLITSDISAIKNNNYAITFLEAGEMGIAEKNKITFNKLNGKKIIKKFEKFNQSESINEKGKYSNFLEKEIFEQPDSLFDFIRDTYQVKNKNIRFNKFSITSKQIKNINRIVLLGMGSSEYAAAVGRYYIESLTGIPTQVENASEFTNRDIIASKNTLIISISQSGETVDTIRAMNLAKKTNALQITITNTPRSQTTRIADATIYLHAGKEIAVASTKCFIAAVAALHALALKIAIISKAAHNNDIQYQINDYVKLPALINETLSLNTQIKKLANKYSKYNNFLFLGRGQLYPIAMEGALKMKELAYIHAEGYSAGEMKHGPIALIDAQMPTIFIATNEKLFDKIYSNVEQVKARKGKVIAIVQKGEKRMNKLANDVIEIPKVTASQSPITTVVVLQLLAYHIANKLGKNIDRPRNLAKTVTVE